jgi:hypothetical protein
MKATDGGREEQAQRLAQAGEPRGGTTDSLVNHRREPGCEVLLAARDNE